MSTIIWWCAVLLAVWFVLGIVWSAVFPLLKALAEAMDGRTQRLNREANERFMAAESLKRSHPAQ